MLMGYCDTSDAEIIALTRFKRRKRRSFLREQKPPTLHYSVRQPRFASGPNTMFLPQSVTFRYLRPPTHPEHLIPRSVFVTLWSIQNGACYLCSKTFTDDDWATREHVTPKSRGGEDGGNILLACGDCNGRKADREPRACERLYLEFANHVFVEHFDRVTG